MTMTREVYSIRGVQVDERKCTLSYGGIQVDVPPRCLSMLRILNERPGKIFNVFALRRKIPQRSGDGASIRSIASILNNALLDCKIPKSVFWIDGTERNGYSLITPGAHPDLSESLDAPAPTTDVHSRPREFSFLMDGMVIDLVAELLKYDESMVPIIARSRETYKRGIEDFAFSVVYATSISSSSDMVDRSNDPARYSRAEITSQLGSMWHFHALDLDLKRGKILENDTEREIVRVNIEAASRCIIHTGWAFRDWLAGEVSRHLGDHESLFEEGVSVDDLVFKPGITLPKYRYPDLQASFGDVATNRAIEFLREATRGSARKYTTSALREFSTAAIVALVTIMRENDISAARKEIWRMPHLLRSLVKQQVIFDMASQQQIQLRSIITQHALAAALRQVEDITRRSLITVLLNMRNASPFREIRQILQEYQLLLSKPKGREEQKARFILTEIARLGQSDYATSERFTLAERTALRFLDKGRFDQYESQLYRVFPVLRPTAILRT
jgi:DNA-binding winged helix-turn-helix (wHTH) protein